MKPFKIEISTIDQGPEELKLQLPIQAEVIREIPGKDRSDYMLATLVSPVFWVDKAKGINTEISNFVICSKFKGQKVDSSMKDLTIAIAYVIDNSLENDKILNLKKCKYIAVAKASAKSKWNIFG
tara:strand:- start:5447 stop:5821 length:375 start_codon:yes stop_codon:yes gene_type:complete